MLSKLGATRARLHGGAPSTCPAGGRPHGRRTQPGELREIEPNATDSVATGATNQDIARALSLSLRTAEHHTASILRKLGVTRARMRDAAL
ncbi:LuxR C-terminal-related transcriptional regulator [Streptomyces sp. BE20]|uniref:LuxR C-terminal-related transcriptional regulator n=1 Tax=unclassified Streptomyces TaxID=2593676 RepID=UPI002E79A9F3|nr:MULTISPECIES: LuxR C-terminal-related transcriptional regulator [unclassified Streptomyces]MEE1825202.1 LuxR C-terminal-related transcriptional regulator [Streptomyces sp. BE20]